MKSHCVNIQCHVFVLLFRWIKHGKCKLWMKKYKKNALWEYNEHWKWEMHTRNRSVFDAFHRRTRYGNISPMYLKTVLFRSCCTVDLVVLFAAMQRSIPFLLLSSRLFVYLYEFRFNMIEYFYSNGFSLLRTIPKHTQNKNWNKN